MTHWKALFDPSEFLFAHDLGGKEFTLQIEKVSGGTISGEKGRKNKKPIVSFVKSKKRLALNKTNSKTIAKMYGNDVENWAGKWITIYPTTTDFGGETVECIRVKPRVPNGKGQPAPLPEPEPEQAAADDGDFMGDESEGAGESDGG